MSFRKQLSKIPFLRNLYFSIKQKRYGRKNMIKGRNNKINNKGRFYKVSRRIFGDNNIINIEDSVNMQNTEIYILGNNNTIIIKKGSSINNSEFWIEGNNCLVQIGENVEVIGANFASGENNQSIEIGDNCLLSIRVELRTSDSHSIIDIDTNKRINQAQSIKVDSHVWIGTGACILKGVSIGSHSIIGANSVVTKDIPSNVAAAGVPAKVIKTNVTWLKDRIE